MAAGAGCKNHPNVKAIEQCVDCSTPLCGMCCSFTDNGVLCEGCVKKREAARFVSSKTDQLNKPKRPATPMQVAVESPGKSRNTGSSNPRWQWLVIVVCIALIGAQFFFATRTAFQPLEKEAVVQLNGAGTLQACLTVFRQIGVFLEQDRPPPDDLRCDASGVPNIVTREAGDVIVEYPHPDFYGLSRIFVSKLNAEPTLVE